MEVLKGLYGLISSNLNPGPNPISLHRPLFGLQLHAAYVGIVW